MRYSIKIGIVIFLSIGVSIAGELGLITDWATFRGDSLGYSWVEIYTKLNRENFKFLLDSTSSNYVGSLFVDIQIMDKAGKIADSLSYQKPIIIPENQPISQQFKLLNVYTFHLPIGKYRAKIFTSDKIGRKSDSLSFDFDLKNYWVNENLFSSIMLSYTAMPSKENTNLDRMGYRMFPNPDGIYDLGSLTLYNYAEFYLRDTTVQKVGIVQKIYADDNLFRSFEPEWRISKKADWFIGGFSVAGFPDGEYKLELQLLDTSGNILARADKNFIVAKHRQIAIAVLDTELVDKYRDVLLYLMKPEQLRTFDKLSKEGKVNFWNKFWSDNDPNPDTKENEFYDRYIARWNYVNKTFTFGNTEGWKTDQGRIYLIYGPPDNIEHHSFQISNNSWEIWHYFDKNYYFIFADVLGLGTMKLVDSNVDGEVQDKYWREKISSPHNPQLFQNSEEE